MRTSDMLNNLTVPSFCAILFLPLNSMPPHRLYVDSSPSCTIACFIFLCIGAAIFGIIHKYFMQPISPVEKFLEKDKDIQKVLKNLDKPSTLTLTPEQEKMINKLKKQNISSKEKLAELHKLCMKSPSLCICSPIFTHIIMESSDKNNKSSMIRTKSKTLKITL